MPGAVYLGPQDGPTDVAVNVVNLYLSICYKNPEKTLDAGARPGKLSLVARLLAPLGATEAKRERSI